MFGKVATVSRYLLGLMFTIFGANGLMMAFTGNGFIPMPPPPPEMITIMTGFMATGYLMGLVALLQFISGILLLSGFFINAAIVFLGPIIVNILLIHVFAERSGLPMAIFTTILFVILVKSRWSDFKQLIKK
ncbi:MAG: acyltransferase [Bdellovibrionales bacterium]|nr:acyltransferase [Bdellovibrionales bacterium]